MKTIAVVGATGAMGRAVVKALVNSVDSEFKIRVLTRRASSKRAKELEEYSEKISIFEADTNDIDSLKKAFKDADGVFCNTDYWTAGSRIKEISLSLNVAKACLTQSVPHLVYSSLENVIKITKSKLTLPYFDSKAEASEYIKSLLPNRTSLVSAPYFENFLGYALPTKRKKLDGSIEFVFNDPMGDKPYTMVALDDIGKFACYCFSNPDITMGKDLFVASDSPTMQEVAEIFTKVTGLSALYEPLTLEEFRDSHRGTVNDIVESPDGEFVGNMFEFIRDYGIKRDYQWIKQINPDVMDFEKWMLHTGWQGEAVEVQNYFVANTKN